jgi:large-conductance mechanosensitive channel
MSQNSMLLTFAVAIFVGSALKDFFTAFTRDIMMPWVSLIFPDFQQTVGGIVLELGPVKLKVGDAIGAGGALVTALVLAAVAFPLLKEYSPIQGGRR